MIQFLHDGYIFPPTATEQTQRLCRRSWAMQNKMPEHPCVDVTID
jgi:hypothetical protein